ncbi:MAG: type II toxin-antitoxin system VapC family toxin [Acidobacteriota bacterium]
MILVDTNVFVIDLRYRRDPLYRLNRRFLDRLAKEGSGATTLFNLLEVAGILSFNLNEEQLMNLLSLFPGQYGIAILPPLDLESNLPRISQGALAKRISRRCAFGDALVIEAVERHAPKAACFVTWDADHFVGRTVLQVMTPERALRTWGRHSSR